MWERFLLLGALPLLCASSLVVNLTPENFGQLTTDGSTWLLDFYAPWCGHCKRLNPILDEIAPLMRIGKIDATQHKKLAQAHDVHGYPSIRYLHEGEMSVYDAPRTKNALLAFAKRLAGPLVRKIDSQAGIIELEAMSDGVYVVLVSLAGERPTESQLKVFQSAAKEFETRTSFGSVSGPEFVQLPPGAASSGVILGLAESAEPLRIAPSSVLEAEESLVLWLTKNLHKRVEYLTPSNYREAMKSGKIFLIFAFDQKEDDRTVLGEKAMAAASRSASPDLMEEFLFCVVEGARFSKYMRRLGARPGPFPMLFAIAQAEGDAIYHLPEEAVTDDAQEFQLTEDVVLEFARGVLDGSVPIYKQSLFKKAFYWLQYHWNKDKQLKLAVTVILSFIGIAIAFLFFTDERKPEEQAGEDSKKND